MSQLLQARDGLRCRRERLHCAVVEFPLGRRVFKSHSRMTHDKASLIARPADNMKLLPQEQKIRNRSLSMAELNRVTTR